MVKRKNNPADVEGQRSLFDPNYIKWLIDLNNNSETSLEEQNNDITLDNYDWSKLTKDSDKFKYYYLNFINREKNKIDKDETSNGYFEEYINKLVDEKVEKKVKEELDRRLGKECYRNKQEDKSIFDGKYTFRNIANNNYFNGSSDKTNDVKKALEEYILLMYDKAVEERYDFTSWDLKSNVKEILEEKGLKQSWLQEKTQIPISTMRSILNNEKAISLENAYKISIVMKMPIEKLFSYIDVDKLYEESLDE